MHCDEIREQFPDSESPPGHLETCAECRQAWMVHTALQSFSAPQLGVSFDAKVMQALESRGHFESQRSVWDSLSTWLQRLLPPATVLACLLLFLWMGTLALTKPGEDLRALNPEKAKLWTTLPDAVPPPALPGAAPSRRQIRLVRGDEQ